MVKSHVSRIEIAQSSEKTLKKLSEQQGMTQIALLSRIVEWFANEKPVLQAAVLGCYPPEIGSEVAELLLRLHASSNKNG